MCFMVVVVMRVCDYSTVFSFPQSAADVRRCFAEVFLLFSFFFKFLIFLSRRAPQMFADVSQKYFLFFSFNFYFFFPAERRRCSQKYRRSIFCFFLFSFSFLFPAERRRFSQTIRRNIFHSSLFHFSLFTFHFKKFSFPRIYLPRRQIKFPGNSRHRLLIHHHFLQHLYFKFFGKLPALVFHSFPRILGL